MIKTNINNSSVDVYVDIYLWVMWWHLNATKEINIKQINNSFWKNVWDKNLYK